MIKRQNLQSMAATISKGLPGLFKNDRKISTFNHSHSSRRINVANIGFNLKGCADYREKVPNLKSKDVGFYKTRVFTLPQQPFSEVELQLQDQKRNHGVLDVNNGGSSLPEKIVVAVDVDEGNCYFLESEFELIALVVVNGNV